MKIKTAVLPLLAVSLCMLTSCGSTAVTENTIELKKGGKVVEYIVEDFEASYYDADEMKSFIDAQVEAYLEESDGSIRVSKDKVEDGVAYVTITYDSADTYADFTGTIFFAGDVLQAQVAGYDFDTDFISSDDAAVQDEESSADTEEETGNADEDNLSDETEEGEDPSDASGDLEDEETEENTSSDEEETVKDESSADAEEQEETSSEIEGTITVASSVISASVVLEDDDLKVLIIDTDVTVIVPGTIQYVSAEGVTITGSNTVSVQISGGAPAYIIYE
ncbi:MAG: hypothetical protein LIO96_04180 [Lachnospiraceae bacterium]|nr:hypothetical protein [Lachnospiraceae bacterium]